MPSGKRAGSAAAVASAAQSRARPGTPATPTVPERKTMSCGLASRRWAASSRALSRTRTAARGRRLDVDGEPAPHRQPLAGRAPPCLLGAQGLVVGQLEQRVQRLLVLAGVVGGATGGGVWEAVGRDQVPAPQLGGVHVQL